MRGNRIDLDTTNRTIVLIEEDEGNRFGLQMVLEEAQYLTIPIPTLHEALPILDTSEYAFVISELFGDTRNYRSYHALLLREHAFPAPIGILTTYRLSEETLDLRPFAFALQKPFEVQDLLTRIAAYLSHPTKFS